VLSAGADDHRIFSVNRDSSWYTTPRHVSLSHLSLIYTTMVAMGMSEDRSIAFLYSFFEGLPASPNQSLSSQGTDLRADKASSYIHHIRVFTTYQSQPVLLGLPGAGVTYPRVNGTLESLEAEYYGFEEHRITIVCTVRLPAGLFYRDTNSIFMMVLDDISSRSLGGTTVSNTMMDWKKRGFTVVGANGVHHLLQATLHGALVVWAKLWFNTLDELDGLVSTEVSTGHAHR
jgi:hypothetical protein